MDILSLHLSQRTLQFGAFRRPNRLCQATVDSYTFGRNRGPPGLRARWSPQNMFRTSKHSRKKDLGGERTWKKVTKWLPWLENLWEKRAKKHAPNMQCTIQHVYMHIYNYIYNTLITSFPRGWKEHMRLSEKKIAPIYHILTICLILSSYWAEILKMPVQMWSFSERSTASINSRRNNGPMVKGAMKSNWTSNHATVRIPCGDTFGYKKKHLTWCLLNFD